jgi:hypothetical protein
MAYEKEPLNRSITDLVAFIAFDGPDASGGAGGSRTLVRRWSGHAFFMLSDTLIVGEDQAVSLARSTRILLNTYTSQRPANARLYQTMPLMQTRLS